MQEAERAAAATVSQAATARSAAAEEVARQKAKAESMRRALEADKAQAEAHAERKRAQLRDQQAKVEAETNKLARLQSEKRAMPTYWEKSIASKSKDGFALHPIHSGRDAAVWKALEKMLATDPAKLRKSGSDRSGTKHDRLRLACAWRFEHPSMWDRYMGGQQQVLRDKRLLEAAHMHATGGLPMATARAASGLPGQLRGDVNEAMLMHGTNPGVMLSMLSTGPNERFSGTNAGTAYGDGTYFAEDAGKNDQYTAVDERYDVGSELHKRLYAHGVRHPGKVYYLLVCRVAMGHHVRTQDSVNQPVLTLPVAPRDSPLSIDDGLPIFPISFRELAVVPNVMPPVHYHALLADVLAIRARYREIVVFHSEFVYPEYVLKKAGLLTLCPSAKQDGQHVFHIIANSNGGPDHVDNYLYALGGSFNIKIGEHLDHVNCFIAGKKKSQLAATIALHVARSPDLHCKIEMRNGKRTLFTDEGSAHKALCEKHPNDDGEDIGNELYERGDREFSRPLRALSREARGGGV